MTAVRKWKLQIFSRVWNTNNLDQNDSLHTNKRLMILQPHTSHTCTDKRFLFRDCLKYVTVPPVFNESVDVPSASNCNSFCTIKFLF